MNQKTRKAPAFLFYADDFLAGTSDMTAEEVGGYIRLLCHQWTKGGIPNDEERAGRMAGLMGSPSIGYVLAKFLPCDDGMLRNARLEQVRGEQEAFRAKQSASGTSGALSRWKKWQNDGNPNGDPNGTAIATPMATPMAKRWPDDGSPSPSPIPIPSPIPTPNPIPSNLDNNAYLGNTALTVQSRFTPPSKIELLEESNRIGLPETEAEKFEAFYESNGWKVGRNKMKSWKHALSGWKTRWSDNQLKGWGRELIGTSTPDDAAF